MDPKIRRKLEGAKLMRWISFVPESLIDFPRQGGLGGGKKPTQNDITNLGEVGHVTILWYKGIRNMCIFFESLLNSRRCRCYQYLCLTNFHPVVWSCYNRGWVVYSSIDSETTLKHWVSYRNPMHPSKLTAG